MNRTLTAIFGFVVVEQVLLGLTRGAGARSLSGMPASRLTPISNVVPPNDPAEENAAIKSVKLTMSVSLLSHSVCWFGCKPSTGNSLGPVINPHFSFCSAEN